MPKQLLIVDDDRELSRMLHATLELFDRSYKIVEVPSAEEALLEAQRTPFDLIIADVRLPGMDGLEMLRRIHKLHPTTQAIIITGGISPAIESESRNLNLVALFPKPLNTDGFIAAVQKALGAENRPAPRAQDVLAYSPTLGDRLSALRRDLGCLAVYLGDLDARVVARAGDVSAFDVEGLLSHVTVAFSASLKICNLLGGLVPQNMHFFDGDEYDVYVLNVGQFYMLVMLFSGENGARQMGQVSRYGRQAADDMLNALADFAPTPAAFYTDSARPEPGTPAGIPTLEFTSPDLPEPIVLTPAHDFVLASTPPLELTPVLDINFDVLSATAKSVADADLDSFWDEALTQPGKPQKSQGNDLSFDQALQLGLVPQDDQEK